MLNLYNMDVTNVITDESKLEEVENLIEKSETAYSEQKDNLKIVNAMFNKIYGDCLCMMNFSEFHSLGLIIKKPILKDEITCQTIPSLMPYWIQKIKMWGCTALSADNISSLIQSQQFSNVSLKEISKPLNRPSFRKKSEETLEMKSKKTMKAALLPFSRIDALVCVLNSVEDIVAQEILNILTKFPISLPLLIRDVNDAKIFKVNKVIYFTILI
jgi:hypothetical protein